MLNPHFRLAFLLAVSILIAFCRFTVPGHALTGWPGFYEAAAHIWVGVLLTLSFQRATRRSALLMLILLSALEILKFLAR